MYSENKYEGFDAMIVGIVRGKARDLARQPEFSCFDVEDLEQELMLDVAMALKEHDAKQSALKTYVRHIVDHKAEQLLEHHHAAKRQGYIDNVRLNALLEDDENDEFACVHGENPEMQMTLRLDIDVVMSKLSATDRQVCSYLREHTISEAAELSGIARKEIYRTLRHLQSLFKDWGLEDF